MSRAEVLHVRDREAALTLLRGRSLTPSSGVDQVRNAPLFRTSRSPRPSRSELPTHADENLMQLVHDGDARAFEVIFERHADASFSLAYRMCGRRSLAEDIVQEAFMSVLRSGARYDCTRGSVRSWLLGVVHNRSVDVFRREQGRTSRDVSDEGITEWMAAAERTEVEVERRDEAQQVRSVLGALPADQRQVIELAYFAGFTHTQIAEMLKLPTGTVKGRMRLGLTKMRIALAEPSDALALG